MSTKAQLLLSNGILAKTLELAKTLKLDQLPFVFSEKSGWKFLRHFSFWCCWYLFQVYLYSFTPSPILLRVDFLERIRINLGESFWFLLPNLFLSYTVMYLVIPELIIPAKYLKAALSVICLIVLTAVFSALLSLTVIEGMRHAYLSSHPEIFSGKIPVTPLKIQAFQALISGLRGSITIGGLAAAIKLTKHVYLKQQQTLLLEKQNAIAELQSLKAQLHPHFLFNTINNIYSHTQETAPVAADMLLQLSALLRYILYSCNEPLVLLEQEISMINDYLELEKKRYGNDLEISLNIPKQTAGYLVAPLLILPFVENCFKHGASSMLSHPWINIDINLIGNLLQMKFINGTSAVKSPAEGGIGIENVRRRLELLYPGKHRLDIVEEEELYIVNLEISTYPDAKL
jgi:two-component system LytT family sensor kinase